MTVNEFTATLAGRLRDAAHTATPKETLWRIASEAARIVGIARSDQVTTATLTLRPKKVFYRLDETILPLVARPLHLIQLGRMVRISMPNEMIITPDWFRAHGPEIDVCVALGRDTLVITPAPTLTTDVTLVYVPVADTLASALTEIPLTARAIDDTFLLAEAVAQIRYRRFDRAGELFDRIAPERKRAA